MITLDVFCRQFYSFRSVGRVGISSASNSWMTSGHPPPLCRESAGCIWVDPSASDESPDVRQVIHAGELASSAKLRILKKRDTQFWAKEKGASTAPCGCLRESLTSF